MRPWIKCATYLLWVVGLIILSWAAYRLSVSLKHFAQTEFEATPLAWFDFIAPFLFGAYFSALFIRSWNCRPNVPLLLCICLPTLVLSMWIPLAWTSIPHGGRSSQIPVPAWVADISMFYIPQFVCGFTLLFGLMTPRSKQIH